MTEFFLSVEALAKSDSLSLAIRLAAVFLFGACLILHGRCSLMQLSTRSLILTRWLAARTLSHKRSSSGISMLSRDLFSNVFINTSIFSFTIVY